MPWTAGAQARTVTESYDEVMQGYRTRKITKILPEAIHSAKSPKHARNLGRRNGRLVLPEATARRTSQRKAFLHDATNLRAGHGQVFATLSMEHALPSQQDDLEPDAGVQAPRSSCQRFKRRLLSVLTVQDRPRHRRIHSSFLVLTNVSLILNEALRGLLLAV